MLSVGPRLFSIRKYPIAGKDATPAAPGFDTPSAPLAAARVIAIMGKSRKNKSKEIFPDDDPEEFAGAPSLERRDEPAVGTSVVARDAFRFPPTRFSHAPTRRPPGDSR